MRKKLLLIVLTPIALIIAFVFLLLVVGLLSSRQHTVTRTLKTKQSQETIWKTITDFQRQTGWRKGLQKVERGPDRNGKEVWIEFYSDGTVIPLETTETKSLQRMVRTIADPSLPFSGVWEMEVKPETDGSSLMITERGEVPNALLRGFVKVFIGYSYSIDHYHSELAAKFGEQAVIQ
jgi:hypothetical protein